MSQRLIFYVFNASITRAGDMGRMFIRTPTARYIAFAIAAGGGRIEGQKTSAFEICDTLGSAPDWLCLPVGNAGNITSYWAGFKQYNEVKSTGLPQVLGVQAAGAAPLVLGHPVENPETVATAIRIGKPARGEQALQAAEESRRKNHRSD